jgi:hypothetical protein
MDEQTFQNLIITCDSSVLYLLMCNKTAFVPHFFSSDPCEQAFAFVRTGRYNGRSTAVSHIVVIEGQSKLNKIREMSEPKQLLQQSKKNYIAHTRQKTVIGEVKGSIRKNLHGDDVTVQTVFDTMEDGTSIACNIAGELPGIDVGDNGIPNVV